MAKLKSEIEVTCPCCHATLVVDCNVTGENSGLFQISEELFQILNPLDLRMFE